MFAPFFYKERTWPNKVMKQAPKWCSVDLRDGNQALVNPMTMQKKLKLFKCLIDVGFKEIEVGFPAAASVEYEFVRTLIDDKLIPDDVTIQVLTQAREELIAKTMRSIIGAPRAIVHLYNSTSIAQREQVFNTDKEGVKNIALDGVHWIKQHLTKEHKNIIFEYSPESFTGTEIEFSIEICEAVLAEWRKDNANKEKVIFNLPATVELFGPQQYADLIECFAKKFSKPDEIIISVHTHNDRGTGVAASELAMLAGAKRVEGTLFGNGERTGNVDIVSLALNLFMHGIDPKLNFGDIKSTAAIVEECTELPIHCRHPYIGELVFTAFSGSHQDAIKKGFAYRQRQGKQLWDLPYLAIDPSDIGRTYKAIIRINSQSGKGGLAYVMEKEFGYLLPKRLQQEFSKVVQRYSETTMKEVSSRSVRDIFEKTYIQQEKALIQYIKMKPKYLDEHHVEMALSLKYKEQVDAEPKEILLEGEGNGPVDAAQKALQKLCDSFEVLDYYEHTLSQGSDAKAIAYIEVKRAEQRHFGVGIDENITVASVKALISAVNFLLTS